MNPVVTQAVICIAVIFNAASFLAFWSDKSRSRKNRSRIPEALLLRVTFIGPLGSLAGIWLGRHNSRKVPFQARHTLILVASAVGHYYLLRLLTG
jgi:uncharacterized membrane protein YsdA (DUF1294 family)